MINGRFCPVRAFRNRRCGGPVDWLLYLLTAATLAVGAWRSVLLILGGE